MTDKPEHTTEYIRADLARSVTVAEVADTIDAQAATIKALVEVLVLADNNLTNLQPKIGNGLVHKDWVPVFDSYIDPVIYAARAAIANLS